MDTFTPQMNIPNYKIIKTLWLLGLFLIFINIQILDSISQTGNWNSKSIPFESERPEHVRLMQLIDHTVEIPSTLRQHNLLFFKNNYIHSNKQADITLNGMVDKHDLFLYAGQWSKYSSALPQSNELLWFMNSGDWQIGDYIFGNSRMESRLISAQTFPTRFQIDISINLIEGTSAGFILWADSSGLTGFVIRYDSTLRSLILARIGPRLEEERLDTFPILNRQSSLLQLRIETANYTIRSFLVEDLTRPILEATNITPMGNQIGWYLYDAVSEFQILSIYDSDQSDPVLFVPEVEEYVHIFDQSVGESQPWYINDHCFIQDQSGVWHLFGTSNTSSPIVPLDEDQFVHATSSSFIQSPWMKQPIALQTDTTTGESQLWAPFIFFKDNLYYMFYCAGSQFSSLEYRIHLATSPDLYKWTRYENNPLFTDYFDARDPMILEEDGQYIMYYTANADRPVGKHIVAYRTSGDLIHWSPRQTAFTYPLDGTYGGPTESPYIVKYENQFYLWIGPENLNTTPEEDYRRTAVYRSSNPYHWDVSDRITSVRSHAAEVIKQVDDTWFVSHSGWFYDGVYIAPLTWKKEPSIQLFLDLGESLNFLTDHFFAMVSDWRGTGGLDLVADYGSFFELTLPVSESAGSTVTLEFEEEGETLLRIITPSGLQTLLDEGNTGPGQVEIHRVTINSDQLLSTSIVLRFSDSDPLDGWGPNVNWIRLYY